MVTTEQLAESKAIQQHTGRTFHVATRFLPERVRHPTYVLYAFFRIADDIVDDPNPGPIADQRTELERLREAALGEQATDEPVLSAFDEMRRRNDIPDREIEVFVEAMESDVEPVGYDTYADLEDYLRGSAVAVAYMMLDVMDPDAKAAARPHARALGEAFQLTNFLRDVREDITEYGRIYLPRTTLARHGVSEDDIVELRSSEGFSAAMRTELRRTEERYREGVAGISLLPEDCQFPVLLSAVLYAEYHRLIRERGFDVLSSPPSLDTTDYLRLVAQTWWSWRRERDPEAVFYNVSPVPESAGEMSTDTPETTGHPNCRTVTRPIRRVADFLYSQWPVGRSWP
ncbi:MULTISPECIES: phytoene/squalene synthase family protein [Halobacterium]|uniref:phytoene/squalene synthase family protein n=1 Tax=Halobacterium TaxID=2239 RepID=UPI0009E764D9|nr:MULTISPECIES: phytoene/squalene synthase family protein [Halobacterium]MCG1002127.1 phytoene/squalene synthase family protein [Halobacterium noricense]